MTDDVYRIKADVSQYSDAIDKLVAAHEKLLKAEGLHATKLSAIEAAEKGATHSIQGVTKAGLSFVSQFKAVNGLLEQTSAKLDVLKHKGGQSVAESIKRTTLSGATEVTTPQVVKIDKAIGDLDELLDRNKFTKKQLEAVWQDVQLGISKKLEGDLSRVQSVFKRLSKLTATPVVETTSPTSSLGARLAADKKYSSQYKELLNKRVAATSAAAEKLKGIELKNSSEILAIKNKASAEIAAVTKAKNAQLKAADKLTGVRAQAKAQKDAESKASEAVVKIATKRKDKLESLLTKLNASRKAHNVSIVKADTAMSEHLIALDAKTLAAKRKSHKDGVASFKAAIRAEETAGRAAWKQKTARLKATRRLQEAQVASAESKQFAEVDRRAYGDQPLGKKVKAQDVIDYHKAEAALFKFLKKYRSGMEDSALATKQIDQVWKDLASGNIKQYEGELERVKELMHQVRKAQSKAAAAGGVASNKSIQAAHRLTGELEKQKAELAGVTLTWKTMFRLVVSQATSRLLSGFLSELSQARDLSLELSKNFARIQTLDNTNSPVAAWQEGVRELSEDSGLDILDLTKASYEALSNQIGEGTQALNFMRAATDLAVVSGASAAESQDILADAIHAWGLEVSDAAEIGAKFFKIVDLGRATVAEMAPNLGRVSIPAAQLGVSLDEVGAALATMTIKGLKAETASTLLRNVLLSLNKPSKEMSALMAELGYSSSDAWLATRKLGGVMADLEKATRGSSTALAKQFPNIRSFTGATIFAGNGLNVYNTALDGISKATATYDKNVNTVKDSLGVLYDKATQKIENIFTFDTAGPLLQKVSDLTNKFEGFVTVAKGAKVVFAALSGGAIPLLVLGIGQLVVASAGLASNLVKLAGPFLGTLAIAASVALAVAGVWAVTTTDMRKENEKLFVEWNKQYDDVEAKARKAYSTIKKESDEAFKKGLQPVREYLAEVARKYNDLAQVNKRSLKQFTADVTEIHRVASLAADESVKASERRISSLESSIKSLVDHAKGLQGSLSKTELDTSLVGATDIEKILTLNKEIERLTELRGKATSSEDFKKISKQLSDALGQKEAIQLKIHADPAALQKAYDEAFDRLDTKRGIYESKGDEVGIKRVQNAYSDLVEMFQADTGSSAANTEYQGVLSDIQAVKAELASTEAGSQDFLNLKGELKYLQDLKGGLAAVFQSGRAEATSKQRIASQKEEAALALELADKLQVIKDGEAESLRIQLEKTAQINAAYKGLLGFKQEDYSTSEKITQTYKEQLDYVEKIQALQGGGLEGVKANLAARQENALNVAGFTEKRAEFEALEKQSGTQAEVALAALDVAKTAVAKQAKALVEFSTKLNVEPAKVISDAEQLPTWLGGTGTFLSSLEASTELFSEILSWNVENPIEAFLGGQDAQVGQKYDEAIFSKFHSSVETLLAVNKAALVAAKPGASEGDLASLKKALGDITFQFKDAQDLRQVDVASLSAEERVKYEEQLSKLTSIEQALINLETSDPAEVLAKAREAQDTARQKVVEVSDARAAIDKAYPELAVAQEGIQVQKDLTTETRGLKELIGEFVTIQKGGGFNTTAVPALNVLPQSLSRRDGQEASGDVISINRLDLSIDAKDQTPRQVAKNLAPYIARELKLLQAKGR
ncbi:phage tail tape measure protein [Candidatus Babeliales bacterium]|nr:phage tail tape measure protein [Candidatus Babeliales bacterium]